MEKPALASNEEARLQALSAYRIDALPDADLDNIVRLASQICETPMSFIGIIDDKRQWYKSKLGLTGNEMPRELTFCGHAILNPDEVMIVPDSRLDKRFHDNPAVVNEPRVIFYAGAPLVDPEGHALGTLCVFDSQPKTLNESQVLSLRALASHTITLLELRRTISRLEKAENTLTKKNAETTALNEKLMAANEELKAMNEELTLLNEQLQKASYKIYEQSQIIVKQKEEQLNRVLDASKDVIWSFDLTGKGESYWSRSASRLFGPSMSGEIQKNAGYWVGRVHPDDLAAKVASEKSLHEKGTTECIYRLKVDEGNYVWLYERIRLIHDSEGVAVRQEGVVSDITSLKEAERAANYYRENLDIIFSNTMEGIMLLNEEGYAIQFNKRIESLLEESTGKKPEVGKRFWEMASPERQEIAKSLFESARRGERIQTDAFYRIRSEWIILEVLYQPVYIDRKVKYVICTSLDVTQKRKQELDINQYRENLEVIFSNTIERILLLDASGRILLFNKSLEKFMEKATGKKPVIGDYVWDMTLRERREAAMELFNRAMGGERIVTRARVTLADEELTHELRYQPVYIAGKVKYVMLTSLDVAP